MLRYTKAKFSIGTVTQQQPAFEQSRDLRRGQAIPQPQHGLEIGALQCALGGKQVVQCTQRLAAHALADNRLLISQAGGDTVLDAAKVEQRCHELHLVLALGQHVANPFTQRALGQVAPAIQVAGTRFVGSGKAGVVGVLGAGKPTQG